MTRPSQERSSRESAQRVFFIRFVPSKFYEQCTCISIWINQAIVCWSGLRPAHLLKMMSQLGEDYRCHHLFLWTIEQDAGK